MSKDIANKRVYKKVYEMVKEEDYMPFSQKNIIKYPDCDGLVKIQDIKNNSDLWSLIYFIAEDMTSDIIATLIKKHEYIIPNGCFLFGVELETGFEADITKIIYKNNALYITILY